MHAPASSAVALVFTDIEKSTPLWERHPVAMKAAIDVHDVTMRAQIESTNSRRSCRRVAPACAISSVGLRTRLP
jgi:class 3 adenylate cyclase